MTATELKERVDTLLTLSGSHPSYLRYIERYLNYLTEHQEELGLEYTTEMQQKLPGVIHKKAKDKNVVLMEAVNDLRVIRKSDSILLNRLPLASYLFARSVAVDFLKEIKPRDFVDPLDRSLMMNNRLYQEKLAKFITVLKSSRDPYGVYSKFRKILITYLMNNILTPENVVAYKKIVTYFEAKIDEMNKYLDKVNESGEINLMDAFGKSTSVYREEEITGNIVLALMDGGISYVIKMKESSNTVDQKIASNLFNLSIAYSGEPLQDYVYGKEYGVEVIYCRLRTDILAAQKVAQSILNLYSGDLLLKTAWNTVYEIKNYQTQYDRDVVIDTTKNNLNLLQQYGIISMETLLRYEERLENEI